MLGLEVVVPEDVDLVLDQVGVLLLHGHVSAEGVSGGGVHLPFEGLDAHHHLEHGLGGDLRGHRVVDAAGNVAVGMGLADRELRQQVVK